jgi:hypothetical protein
MPGRPQTISFREIEKKILHHVGEVNTPTLDQLVGLFIAIGKNHDLRDDYKSQAVDSITPILSKELISLPGHGTFREEAQRLVDIVAGLI